MSEPIDPAFLTNAMIDGVLTHVYHGQRYVHSLQLLYGDGSRVTVDLASCDTDHIGVFQHSDEHARHYEKP